MFVCVALCTQARICHPWLNDLLAPVEALYADIRHKAVTRLQHEGRPTHDPGALTDLGDYAMARYAYYLCCSCQRAYYGGEVKCEEEAEGLTDAYDPTELICGACSNIANAQVCVAIYLLI
jgi:E3 ubiquitin-protein ligase MYCBP2